MENNSPVEQKTENKTKKKKKLSYWKIATVVLGILFVVSIFTHGFSLTGLATGGNVANKALDFINKYLVEDSGVVLKSVDKESGLYKLTLLYKNQEIPAYVTTDGKYLVLQGMGIIEMDKVASMLEAAKASKQTQETQENQNQEVPKSDKPQVELFVMSYCPFGTQMEKGILPVLKLLDGKIDFTLRFVDYAMHGEKEVYENLRQVCIQKEQPEKLIPYLECFLKDGNSEACLDEVGIDKDSLEACEDEVDKEFQVTENLNDKSTWQGNFPPFDVDKTLNQEYGVRGSPTLVINGITVRTNRNPASLLETICSAFTTPPTECNENLSTQVPSPGFGYEGEGSNSGTCE